VTGQASGERVDAAKALCPTACGKDPFEVKDRGRGVIVTRLLCPVNLKQRRSACFRAGTANIGTTSDSRDEGWLQTFPQWARLGFLLDLWGLDTFAVESSMAPYAEFRRPELPPRHGRLLSRLNGRGPASSAGSPEPALSSRLLPEELSKTEAAYERFSQLICFDVSPGQEGGPSRGVAKPASGT